ncbi:MAG: thermonuclease family protein [Xanthobacteraceae bacterium]
MTGPGAAQTSATTAKPDCPLADVGTGKVASVHDGRTLLLADGREVRLDGIEVPGSADARERLAALAQGRQATLKADVAALDRYGRVVAYVFIDGRLLQTELLTSGFAVVGGRLGSAACAAALRGAERGAREARRGLWANAGFRLQSAANPADILREAGRFTVVRGKVLSVRESGATIYVNFGRRWSDDFTVTILKRNRRLFSAAQIEPKSLEGRVIEVRGYVEQRSGPLIEASRPEQIEIVQ